MASGTRPRPDNLYKSSPATQAAVSDPARVVPPAQIKALVASAGISDAEVARLLEVTDRAYRRWKAGDRRMHPHTWEVLQNRLSAIEQP